MNASNNFFPENYYADSSELYQMKRKERHKVSNSYPRVIGVFKKTDVQCNYSYRSYVCEFSITGLTNIIAEFKETDLTSSKFQALLPPEVIVEPAYNNKIRGIFSYIIKSQANTLPVTEEKILKYGWNDNVFAWDDKINNINKKCTYEAVNDVVNLMLSGNTAVISLILAAIHGPLRKVLVSAGIDHNYVTYIVGETSIGKTAISEKICNYNPVRNAIFSFGSKRCELKKQIQESSYSTLIIDDFNKTVSPRVFDRQLHILAEIVQSSSNAGRVLLDSSNDSDQSILPHLIVTAESLVGSCSFLNRLYLVEMEEMLQEDLWQKLNDLSHNNKMLLFMMDFMNYVTECYDEISDNIKVDYQNYLTASKQKTICKSNSMNRLNNTKALQLTLLKILSDYFKVRSIDDLLREKAYKISAKSIFECMSNLSHIINEKTAEAHKMQFLPTLASIVHHGVNQWTEFLKYSEKAYLKAISGGKPNPNIVGCCIHNGYISFQAEHMCSLIADELGVETIAPKALSRELKEYSLAFISSEGKTSCIWGCKQRMFHVRVLELVELAYDEEVFVIPRQRLTDMYKAR